MGVATRGDEGGGREASPTLGVGVWIRKKFAMGDDNWFLLSRVLIIHTHSRQRRVNGLGT